MIKLEGILKRKMFIQEKTKEEENNFVPNIKTPYFWDIGSEKVQKGSFQERNRVVENRLFSYGKDSGELRKKRMKYAIVGMLGFIPITFVLIRFFLVLPKTPLPDIMPLWIILAVITWIPLINFLQGIKKIELDMVKKKICDQEGWEYSPEERQYRWNEIVSLYEEILNMGTERQNIQDEIWGNFEKEGKTFPFWTGIFHYVVKTGSGKRRSSKTYYKTLFAIQLPKYIRNKLVIQPKGLFSALSGSIFSFFGRKTISTASINFNKEFTAIYTGKEDAEMEIVSQLSPRVQELLLEFEKIEKDFILIMKNDIAIFSVNGVLLPKVKTNFFDDMNVAPEDVDFIKNRLKKMLEITSEIRAVPLKEGELGTCSDGV